MDGIQALIFKAGRPATSCANAGWMASWFSGKLVKLMPPDVRF